MSPTRLITRRELARCTAAAGIACAVPRVLADPPGGAPGRVAPQAWRRDFPALAQHVNGRQLTYLDSAATTLRPRAVIETIATYYARDNANPGAELHSLARGAYEQYEAARGRLARFINAGEPDEIVFTRGTTEGINLVAASWARANLVRGDEILLTIGEHASNLLPWRRVAAEREARVVHADVDDAGRVRIEDLERKLNKRTRLVAFSHVSNVAGFVNPAAEICAKARQAGALVLVDAAQSAPHVPLDVQALGCDFLAFSSHKVLGPMGIGVLYARRELLEQMPPYQSGAKMAHSVDFDTEALAHAAHKFGAGTPDVAGAIGLAAAVEYLDEIGRDTVLAHEAQLTRHALARLRDIPELRLLGPTEPAQRVPVFSFVLPGHGAGEILRYLDGLGIAIRAGDLSALPLLRRFGISEAARFSCHMYTTPADIDLLVDSVQALLASHPSRA